MNTKIKKLRKENNLTQKDMGDLYDISKSAYNKKEKGKANFTLEDVKRTKEIFNLTDEEVIKIFLT